MISLAWPWVLAALPLPWLVWRFVPAAPRPGGGALRVPFLQALTGPAAQARRAARRGHRLLAWLAWLLLVLAAARPQWPGEPVALPQAGRDLMLAVDVSGSMAQADYRLGGRPLNRLDLVKAVAGRFIDGRDGDRLGLVLFGSRAYLQTPLTHDRATVRRMLEEAVVGLAGRDTAIGDAIAVAVKRLQERPGEDRALILLTDGANTVGAIAPLAAAHVAARAGVRIYTIGIGGGAPGRGSPFGVLPGQGPDLDPVTLQEIARVTGGRYFQAGDADSLAQVYTELDRLEPTLGAGRRVRPMQALHVWPAGAALLISVVLALPPARRAAPPPRAGRADV